MVNKKGSIVRQMFFSYLSNLKHTHLYEDFDNDTLATCVYNITVLGMKKILENSNFFEKECKIRERNRIRMRKDLENMVRLKYPETCKYPDSEMKLREEYPINKWYIYEE